MRDLSDTPRLEEPQARLEQALIDDFLRMRGYDPDVLRARDDAEAKMLLTQAATYAATKLTEVESRAHYVHDIHGGPLTT
jgi:hypothetical protein